MIALNDPPAWQKWVEMSDLEKSNKISENTPYLCSFSLTLLAGAGEKAIDKFLAMQRLGSRKPTLPSHIRAMIRAIQPFLPHAAMTNRELALHCLNTTWNNHLCHHHQWKAKRQPIKDGDKKGLKVGKYLVTGVPGPRVIKESLENDVEPSYLSCGCSEEDVLIDFYFWKMWTITSPTTGETEGWKDQYLDPRARAFVITAFTSATTLRLDDLYTELTNKRVNKQRLLGLQKTRIEKRLADLELLDLKDIKDLEDEEAMNLKE